MNTTAAALGLLLIIGIGPALAAPAPAPQIQAIAATDVRSHIGQTVTVESVVGEVHHSASGSAVFVNMDGHYPNNAFTVVIFKDDLSKFSNLDTLKGRTVRVTGAIKLYRGMPEIVLSDPGKLKVKDGA